MGFPKFKLKGKAAPRFAYATGFRLIEGDTKALRLPGIGRIRCVENVAKRVGDARVLRVTVSRRAGRWCAPLAVERDEPEVEEAPEGGAVGVGLGVKTLAVLSGGAVVDSPRRLLEAGRKLKEAQRALSRKTRGSSRRAKARLKVARLHAHVANQRSDALRKLTAWLTEKYSEISVEGLHVAGMVKNRHLAKSVSDAAFGGFRRQLEYKAARTGAQRELLWSANQACATSAL